MNWKSAPEICSDTLFAKLSPPCGGEAEANYHFMISDTKNKSSKLKLLILTQKVDKNDDVLGFFHAWVEEFAKHSERVTVICLEKGECDFPLNVKVLSLGKEAGLSRFRYLARFYHFIFRERRNYDTVFVHMNPEYVVLGGFLWRGLGKKVALWYAHKQVNLKLRIAEKLVHVIFTASRESFRLASKKVRVMGHGIDALLFHCGERAPSEELRLVTVGRIAPAKDLDMMADACARLSDKGISFCFDIIGESSAADKAYEKRLRRMIRERGLSESIRFSGPMNHAEIAKTLCSYDVFLHASAGTGSLDKAPLEAMCAGIPVISASVAFRDILAPHDMFVSGAAEMVERVMRLRDQSYRRSVAGKLQKIISETHDLPTLISRMSMIVFYS
jgi:glycosyltransferase involved in cell wall biosynthesis